MSEADATDDGWGRHVLESFLYPGRSSDAPRSLALACLLSPTVVAPAGYALVVTKAALGHRTRPSNLVLDRALLRDGTIVAGVALAYLLPAAAIAVLNGPPAVAWGIGIGGGYLLPAAVVTCAEQDARAALRVWFLIDVAFTGSYLRTLLGSAALVAAVAILVNWTATRASPLLAAVVGIWLAGYLVLVIGHRHAMQYDGLRHRGRTVDHGSTGVPV